jgi:hypothetical protein
MFQIARDRRKRRTVRCEPISRAVASESAQAKYKLT